MSNTRFGDSFGSLVRNRFLHIVHNHHMALKSLVQSDFPGQAGYHLSNIATKAKLNLPHSLLNRMQRMTDDEYLNFWEGNERVRSAIINNKIDEVINGGMHNYMQDLRIHESIHRFINEAPGWHRDEFMQPSGSSENPLSAQKDTNTYYTFESDEDGRDWLSAWVKADIETAVGVVYLKTDIPGYSYENAFDTRDGVVIIDPEKLKKFILSHFEDEKVDSVEISLGTDKNNICSDIRYTIEKFCLGHKHKLAYVDWLCVHNDAVMRMTLKRIKPEPKDEKQKRVKKQKTQKVEKPKKTLTAKQMGKLRNEAAKYFVKRFTGLQVAVIPGTESQTVYQSWSISNSSSELDHSVVSKCADSVSITAYDSQVMRDLAKSYVTKWIESVIS